MTFEEDYAVRAVLEGLLLKSIKLSKDIISYLDQPVDLSKQFACLAQINARISREIQEMRPVAGARSLEEFKALTGQE